MSEMAKAEPFSQMVQKELEQYLRNCLEPDFLWHNHTLRDGELDADTEIESPLRTALAEVLEPMRQLVFRPGKRWRPTLCLLHSLLGSDAPEGKAASRLQSPRCRRLLGPLVALVELLHNATLVADDIEDGGELRRGIPALHLSHGLDRALNACNWSYFAASILLRPLQRELIGKTRQLLHLQQLSQECLDQIHLGQALDIRWHRQHDYLPTAHEYFCMASLKTGALAGFAAELGVLAGQLLWPEQLPDRTPSSANEQPQTLANSKLASECRRLWQRIGRAFQVLDDLLNITVGNPGKLRGDDWLEGKKSLPLCLFAQGGLQVSHSPKDESRRQQIASWMQRARRAASTTSGCSESGGLLAATLEQLLDEFLAVGRAALLQSAAWLERELLTCRELAERLYAPFEGSPCPAELLGLLDRLDAETGHCRDFIGGDG